MFFKTTDINAEGLYAFRLERRAAKAPESVRTYHALSFRIKGTSTFKYNGQTFCANQGDIVFAPAFLQYTQECEDESLYIVHFYSDNAPADELLVFTPSMPKQYEKLFFEMYNAGMKKYPGYENEIKSIFYKILSLMERENQSSVVSIKSTGLENVISYIHENFTVTDISVASLAEKMNMSETYFRRIFKKQTGVSPACYINNLKTQYAIELLNSGYYTVAEISDMFGFCNPYYFSSFIKKRTGKTPKEFKKKD